MNGKIYLIGNGSYKEDLITDFYCTNEAEIKQSIILYFKKEYEWTVIPESIKVSFESETVVFSYYEFNDPEDTTERMVNIWPIEKY